MTTHDSQDSMDIDINDIDNLVGDMMDDIPSKDSSDDDNRQPQMNDTYSNAIELQHYDTDNMPKNTIKQTNKKIQINNDSINMNNYNINEIDNFGEEEKQYDNINRVNSDLHLPDMDLTKSTYQDLLDTSVMTLLHPDYYTEPDLKTRRKQLKKQTVTLQEWKNTQIDTEIVNVADAMSKIESIAMYDQDWHTSKHKDDQKTKENYVLQEEDLSVLRCVPDSFFGKEKNIQLQKDLDAAKSVASTATADYLRTNTDTGDGVNIANLKFGLGGAGNKGNVTVCGACGVKLQFKAKYRNKYNYMGYICRRTKREWIFHDYLCVKLRKIKEAIKDYVYFCEKDENINVEDENALINIDTNVSQKRQSRMRPNKKTTPKKGDHNYNLNQNEQHEESSRARSFSGRSMYSNSDYDEDDVDRYGRKQSEVDDDNKFKKNQRRDKLGYIIADDVEVPIYLDFRRYRTHIKRILDRLNEDRTHIKGATYSDRFGDLPEILLYCDLNEFGVAIFEFVSDSLKSKMRKSLWHILAWLALEMPTNEMLHLLKRHTYLLSKHELVNYDKVCKATMEGSKFPIACTLRLSAFMYERAEVDLSNREAFRKKGNQYVNVSRKLLKEIESDHLFALLLMIPTDIGHQNVIEIALKYDLTHFLEEPRIVRVFSVIWFNGYDFLDPDNSFGEPDISVDTVFDKLIKQPGRFFFSPFGKFLISSILYLGYLGLFSYVTFLRLYDYPTDYSWLEIVLWISSAGYVVYEVLEFGDSPDQYFSSMTNYWDILIALNWIILFFIRFVYKPTLIYGDDGTLDEIAQRNTLSTEIYMGIWAAQCVILWTRVASLFKISERAGPLIRMITNMLGDVANFFLIWGLFFLGGSFAAYYIIGNDLMEFEDVKLGTFSSVSFYIFKTLIGQQNWDKTASKTNPDDESIEVFDAIRSNMLQTLLFIYSIFGTILLLNLLIAMMASSYETVKDKSLQEVNKQKIDTIYDLDRSASVITPPFNVLAYLFYVYWYAFEIITWALTFGRRQFNEEKFSPINRGLYQYSVGDIITFNKSDRTLKGICIKKIPKALRNTTKRSLGRASMINSIKFQEKMAEEDLDCDLIVVNNDIKYELRDNQIKSIKKTFFKRRKMRIPSLSKENLYCRYCRYNLTHDKMTIEHYLSLFELRGQHIDPDDKRYMEELLTTSDKYGIPTPLTCNLCPNCFRPFKVLPKGPDVLSRTKFVLEIVSFLVFFITLWWIIILIIFIPACIVKIIKFVIKIFTSKLSVFKCCSKDKTKNNKKTKSIMNTSEQNDDYRAKVRQVSKSEEKLDAVV
eukprot:13123_1